jgi:hypothetical protein
MIEPARSYRPEFSALELAEVSAAGAAAALGNLYHDPQHCQQLARAAYQAAQNREYSWDTIAERFDDLFAELASDDISPLPAGGEVRRASTDTRRVRGLSASPNVWRDPSPQACARFGIDLSPAGSGKTLAALPRQSWHQFPAGLDLER